MVQIYPAGAHCPDFDKGILRTDENPLLQPKKYLNPSGPRMLYSSCFNPVRASNHPVLCQHLKGKRNALIL